MQVQKKYCSLSPDETGVFFNKIKHPFKDGTFERPGKKADLTGALKEKYDTILNFSQAKCLEAAKKRREKAIFKDKTPAESDCRNIANRVTDSTVTIDIDQKGLDVYFFGTDDGWFVYFFKEGKYEFNKVDAEFSLNCFLNEKYLHTDKCNFLKKIKGAN